MIEATPTLERVEDEAIRVAEAAQAQGIVARMIGGLAIRARCPSANHAALERTYPDVDLVVVKEHARHLEAAVPAWGYGPDRVFNTLNGDRRLLFRDAVRGRQMDVFVGDFDMAHRIPMAHRLRVDSLTVPLAELFLSKAQIVALNHKDVLDLLALLLDHAVAECDGETINLRIVAGLCAADWGLHTTVSMTLARLSVVLDQNEVGLQATQRDLVRRRVHDLQQAIDEAPKTLAWILRARVGKRVRWYQEVEEVQR